MLKSNAGELAERNRRRAERLRAEMDRAQRANGQEAVRVGIALSSATAYRMPSRAHPYSRRRPAPPGPAYLANVQSGRMRNAWKFTYRQTADGGGTEIENTAPESRFFTGSATRTMIARPLLQEWLKRMRGKRLDRDTAAWRRGMKGDD